MEVKQVDKALRYLAEVDGMVLVSFASNEQGELAMQMEAHAHIAKDGGRRQIVVGQSIGVEELETGFGAAFALIRSANHIHKAEAGRTIPWS